MSEGRASSRVAFKEFREKQNPVASAILRVLPSYLLRFFNRSRVPRRRISGNEIRGARIPRPIGLSLIQLNFGFWSVLALISGAFHRFVSLRAESLISFLLSLLLLLLWSIYDS